jgi:hypothetical protein
MPTGGRYCYMSNVTALVFNEGGGGLAVPLGLSGHPQLPCRLQQQPEQLRGHQLSQMLHGADALQRRHHEQGQAEEHHHQSHGVRNAGDKPYNHGFFLHANVLHGGPQHVWALHMILWGRRPTAWCSGPLAPLTMPTRGDGGQLVRFDLSQPCPWTQIDRLQHRQCPLASRGKAVLRQNQCPAATPAWAVHPTGRVMCVRQIPARALSSPSPSTPRRCSRAFPPGGGHPHLLEQGAKAFKHSIRKCVDQDNVFASGSNNNLPGLAC